MSAFLVERDPVAYSRLDSIRERFPDISVHTYREDFVTVLPTILSEIPAEAFTFFFIDPKGWRIQLRALERMLARPKSEVIFNFMFEFINRAASMHDPIVANGLDELIPYGNWREKLREAEKKNASGVGSDERKTILINAFADSLAHIGNYKYVAETTILRPLRNRALYCLFYATRHPKGLEVYRDCQVKAINEQSRSRAVTKVKHSETVSGQGEIFSSLHEMGPNEILSFLESEIVAARNTMLELTPFEPQSIRYGELWPQVLVRHVVRLTNLNKIGAQFWKEGLIHFPDWEKGNRVPQTDYRMQPPRN